jgi:hypothetical protein
MAQEFYRSSFVQHAVARFMAFRVGGWKETQFLMEWLTYCLNPRAQTFDVSTIHPEYQDLIEHRTEQAIFTNLAHKYGYRLYREACQFGEGSDKDRDLYGQLFFQDGGKTAECIERGSAYRTNP